ncbi:hypothetical protein A9Q83_13035 [Alphaproteobacteria bacterium 46_93_T64]|nr:hypothetical protein A9Q83_13035 [Alphaproteobacteria bacterium 46_93_T64]
MKKKTARIFKKVAICGVVCVTLTGCAETIIAGLTLSELFTAGSITSSILTGKGFGEHALDAVTGQDCRILDAIFRSDRAICEPKNSIATQDDFKGLIALLDTPAGQDIQLVDIPMGKDQFPSVNKVALKNGNKWLSTLNRNNVAALVSKDTVAEVRFLHLTQATKAFEPRKVDIPSLSAGDLRKRLTSNGLF